jgi:hypothetical protein
LTQFAWRKWHFNEPLNPPKNGLIFRPKNQPKNGPEIGQAMPSEHTGPISPVLAAADVRASAARPRPKTPIRPHIYMATKSPWFITTGLCSNLPASVSYLIATDLADEGQTTTSHFQPPRPGDLNGFPRLYSNILDGPRGLFIDGKSQKRLQGNPQALSQGAQFHGFACPDVDMQPVFRLPIPLWLRLNVPI